MVNILYHTLEWLIKTDTVYSGDLLYVKAYEPSDERQTYYVEDMKQLYQNSTNLMHYWLEYDILVQR